jgi:hypothetical protein
VPTNSRPWHLEFSVLLLLLLFITYQRRWRKSFLFPLIPFVFMNLICSFCGHSLPHSFLHLLHVKTFLPSPIFCSFIPFIPLFPSWFSVIFISCLSYLCIPTSFPFRCPSCDRRRFIFSVYPNSGSQGSSGFGVWFLAVERHFSLLHDIQTGSEAHSVFYIMGTGAVSTVVKEQGHEVVHLPATSPSPHGTMLK